MKRIILLGSTGSIGRQTLEACRRLDIVPEVLTAYGSVDMLEQQARAFSPRLVVVGDEKKYGDLCCRLADTSVEVRAGRQAVLEAASMECDVVCNAIVGAAGLEPTLAALSAGRTVALSNKESLVAGGALVMKTARENQGTVLPVDSEHSAIFQCLMGNDRRDLRRIWLTASGGPFRGRTKAELETVTVQEALRHPNWRMGKKITIDSATLMNKGLEVIEAMWLFGLTVEEIQVVVHPESILHSAVEFADGSVIGQMGVPNMAVPIQYALTYPRRYATSEKALSLLDCGHLTFYPPDIETFTCLGACLAAAKAGGLAPCAVNGANEEAVALFLAGKIDFCQIGEAVWRTLAEVPLNDKDAECLADILAVDAFAREMVHKAV